MRGHLRAGAKGSSLVMFAKIVLPTWDWFWYTSDESELRPGTFQSKVSTCVDTHNAPRSLSDAHEFFERANVWIHTVHLDYYAMRTVWGK